MPDIPGTSPAATIVRTRSSRFDAHPTATVAPGIEHAISSDGFFELEDLPAKTAVVGAGYVAVELAGVLQVCGPRAL